MYSFTLSLTSALDWGGWSAPRPVPLPPERPGTHCIGGWVAGHQGRSERVRKIWRLPGFAFRAFLPVASCITA